jgi:hypothetical protein
MVTLAQKCTTRFKDPDRGESSHVAMIVSPTPGWGSCFTYVSAPVQHQHTDRQKAVKTKWMSRGLDALNEKCMQCFKPTTCDLDSRDGNRRDVLQLRVAIP